MPGISKSGLRLEPYNIGNIASNSVNITSGNINGSHSDKYMQSARYLFALQGDSTFRTVFTGFNDVNGVIKLTGGDSPSKDTAMIHVSVTSPAYGVSSIDTIKYTDGGWNTGGFNWRILAVGNYYYFQVSYASYYSASNVGTFTLTYDGDWA